MLKSILYAGRTIKGIMYIWKHFLLINKVQAEISEFQKRLKELEDSLSTSLEDVTEEIHSVERKIKDNY